MRPLITVREHARLTSSAVPDSAVNTARVSESVFDWLVTESARLRGADRGAQLVELQSRCELRLDNYVGVLQSPCGTRIEILPKALELGESIHAGRDLLQRMLSRCLDLSPRQSNPTALRTFNAPLTEWVAHQFLHSLDQLLKRGLRFDYQPVQRELRFLRGRLLVGKQLRQPPGRAHYFQVEHDIFDPDRAENRLIRSALESVCRQARTQQNWRLAHELAHCLHDLPASSDIAEDFRRWRDDRLMAHYREVRPWCSLILHEQMPLTVVGSQQGQSLLFPMEKVFEQYVGQGLREWLPAGSTVRTQVAEQCLTQHRKTDWFKLRPDFVIQHRGMEMIADAKWKLLDSRLDTTKHKYQLSQADFYQLYAYGQKYLNGRGMMYLLFPKHQHFTAALPPFDFSKHLQLQVVPFDLEAARPLCELPEQPIATIRQVAST